MRGLSESKRKYLREYRARYCADRPGYSSWTHMVSRCSSPANKAYAYYGGRGIRVAPEWVGPGGYEVFIEHVGPRPSDKHTVDRIDVNGNYEPGNVRWATRFEQAVNRRDTVKVEFLGSEFLLSDLAKLFDIKQSTLYGRVMRAGMSAEDAVRMPLYGRKS